MGRSAWTDDRLDDFAGETRAFRTEMREEMRDLRKEMRDLRKEMREGFDRVDAQMDALHADLSMWGRQTALTGWTLAVAVIAALVAAVT